MSKLRKAKQRPYRTFDVGDIQLGRFNAELDDDRFGAWYVTKT